LGIGEATVNVELAQGTVFLERGVNLSELIFWCWCVWKSTMVLFGCLKTLEQAEEP
jgi:hypothetical protein